MMGFDHKKVAMLIVKGLADFNSDKSTTEDQEVKTPKENSESDDSRLGEEVAMEKFIEAVKSNDVKKACAAMREFSEMCSGTEYVSSSPKSMYDED